MTKLRVGHELHWSACSRYNVSLQVTAISNTKEVIVSYQPRDPGDWGSMQEGPGISIATEELIGEDGCKHFLRSWKTEGSDVLLIMHGLGGHSGWYIDMGNVLSSHGINIYAMDHRGFGRSSGLAGHINDYHTYVKDIVLILNEIRTRHPQSKIYVLGHSMGGL